MNNPIWLNIGSGKMKINDFVNIDIDPNVNPDLVLDVSKQRLPYDDNSVNKIYCSHLIEHLTFEKAKYFLCECCRVLSPTGILELNFPDINFAFQNYDKERYNAFSRAILWGDQTTEFQIHKSGYTATEMVALLEKIGFQIISCTNENPHYTQSQLPEKSNICIRATKK